MKNITLQSGLLTENYRTPSCERAQSAARSRILIADACALRRRELIQILSGLPLDVVEAENAGRAIEAVPRHGIDLALVEFSLNGGALPLCQKLKQASPTSFLPVFVIAPSDNIEDEVQAMQVGADDFFAAPLRSQAFRARVQAILRHKAEIDTKDRPETVLYSLAQSVEGRDPDLGHHCERLALMTSALGLALGLPEQDIITLRRAAYLHDIGKISIPDSILFKAGPLTPEEWEVMKSHPERGERICSGLRSLAPVLPVVRHHHEKWDGTGYPDSLAGEEIPLLARILQLTDIYDALTHTRCYKRAFTPQEAMGMIGDEARKGWRDPQLTQQFTALVPLFSMAEAPDLSGLSLYALADCLREAEI